MQKIFIFGDSIAYGAWDPAGGWVERLRQWLFVTTRDEYNLGTFLYNLSIVGDTTADLLKRFIPEIEARQPGDIIFFAAGINDAQFVNGRPMATPAAVCTNVRMLIQHARAFAPLLCWVGLTPVDEARTTRNERDHVSSAQRDKLEKRCATPLASRHGMGLAPVPPRSMS